MTLKVNTTFLETTSVSELPLVGPAYVKRLKKLGIETIWDLMHHIPSRFLDFSKKITIDNLVLDEIATIRGVVTSFVNTYTKSGKAMQIVTVTDGTGKVDAIWFNQLYLSRTFREGTEVNLAGKLTWMGRKKAMIAPEYEIVKNNGLQIHTGHLIPIYPETAGISSKWIRRRMFDAWKKYKNDFEEFLNKETLLKYDLMPFNKAIEETHFPVNMESFEKAKRRLAFNELLNLHLKNTRRRKSWMGNRATPLTTEKTKVVDFINSLAFSLTGSQKTVVAEILKDLEQEVPMNRLLEGDVGSGKTVVAAIAAYHTFLSGKKTLFMVPTQILAHQHFQTLTQMFKETKVKLGLVTSVAKNNLDADILIGTHALLNKNISLADVALVIIDEQHKFGVEQRNILIKKGKAPHTLTMTATPIPRSVALTFFGDLDLSVLDELPKGRQKIVTWVVPEAKRDGAYDWMEKQIMEFKSQVFVVCPLIDNSDKETMKDVKNVNTEYLKLKDVFKKRKIGLLHGKLKAKEKSEAVASFQRGESDILVATAVVEVGIDIANATIMMIEAADRFGLASLHQLRGRVGRGAKKSYCLLMTENNSDKTQARLTAMTTHVSGFKLAELDLQLRGPGEIYGAKQSGVPELRIADWNDVDLIKNSKTVAEEIAGKL